MKRFFQLSFIAIVILGTVVYFYYDYWLEKELKYKLSEIISKDPNNLYEYSFTKLDIHLLEGSVELKGIKIKPKPYAFDSLTSLKNGMRYLVDLTLEEIQLKNFEIKEFLMTGKIFVKSLIITEPVLNYYFHPQKKGEEKSLVLSNLFSDKFKEANIEQFIIQDANVSMLDHSKASPAVNIHHLTIELTEAKIDSALIKQFTPIYYQDIQAKAAGVKIASIKEFEINSDTIVFEVDKETIEVYNFQINPKYSQQAFAKAFKVQKQWFALHLDKLVITKIDFNKFVHSGAVDVGKISIIKPNIGLYKDKSKPLPPFKKKMLPATAIKAIPWNISVDSVQVVNGMITINETSALTGRKSNLTFNDLNALVLNFTNDSLHRAMNSELRLLASTKVMNTAYTELIMRFDLNSDLDEFMAKGTVGPVDAKAFNPVLDPLMGVKVISGKINNLNFTFTAMDTLSTGTLDIEYQNIRLNVLKTDTTSKKNNSKKGFVSLAANTVVKSNNLRSQGNYLQGIIHTKRVLEKDVWPFLWHSIQSGLVSTLVPMTNSKEVKQEQKKVKKKLRQERKDKE